MKKIVFILFALPICAMADNVATTAALSTLQQQITQLQQQLQSSAQAVETANQNFSNIADQLKALQSQVNQYGNASISQFKWVDVNNNQIPQNAFVAASNKGKALYICQANYSNGSGYYGGGNTTIEPGVVRDKGCVITYGGQAYLVPQYSVLTANVPGAWINGELIKTNNSQPPVVYFASALKTADGSHMGTGPDNNANEPTPLYNALAIIGGQENGSNIYICRVQINQQYFIGKAANNTCYIATGKFEASWPVFEVLLTRTP